MDNAPPQPITDAAEVRTTLHALRRRPVRRSALPLLRFVQGNDDAGALDVLCAYLLQIAWSGLSRTRDSVGGTAAPATPGAAAAGIAADFQSGNADREAWSALLHRFFACRMSVGDVAVVAGVDRRTVQRRLQRGYELMALRLNALAVLGQVAAAEPKGAHELAGSRQRHNIPQPATPLIGRQASLARLVALMEQARCITVIGPGGVGKSRLAREAALRATARVPSGTCWVALDDVADASGFFAAAAAALERMLVRLSPDPEALVAAIGRRRMLLILDGADFHLPAIAEWVARAVAACPELSILATSRSRLGVAGEQVFQVGPMSVPPRERTRVADVLRSDACRLFALRAAAVRPGFRIDTANAEWVAQICRQLDGLPLAIELAAARVRTTSVADIAEQLDDPFAVLVDGGSGASSRHRTLEAVLAWSMSRLDERPRRVLGRLATFQAPFDLDDARAVCADAEIAPTDIARAIHVLVDQSLLLIQEGSDGTYRYAFLQAVRAYVRREQSAEEHARWQQRLADYVIALASQHAAALDGPSGPASSLRLRARAADLDHVLPWLLAKGEPEAALRATADLGDFWLRSGLLDSGRRHLEAALAATSDAPPVDPAPGQPAPVRVRALEALGGVARQQCDYAVARQHLAEAIAGYEHVNDPAGAARALRQLGAVADEEGDYPAAEAAYREALRLYEVLDDAWGMAAVHNNLGVVATNVGDLSAARALLEKSLTRFTDLQATWAVGVVRFNLGNAFFDAGDYPRAEAFYRVSLSIASEGDDALGVAAARIALGNVAAKRDDAPAARAHYAEAWEHLDSTGDLQEVAEWLEAVGQLDVPRGDGATGERAGDGTPDRALLTAAVQALSAAAALRAQIGAPIVPKDASEMERDVAALRAALGEDAFRDAWLDGRLAGWRAIADAWHEHHSDREPRRERHISPIDPNVVP